MPKENEEGRDVYNRICLFYYVMNQPTVKSLQDPIKPTSISMQNSWLTDWMRTYADELGKFLRARVDRRNPEFWRFAKLQHEGIC